MADNRLQSTPTFAQGFGGQAPLHSLPVPREALCEVGLRFIDFARLSVIS